MAVTVARGLVLVSPVETQERFAGGLIVVPEQAREKLAAHQMRVVAVGGPEFCEEEDCDRDHVWEPCFPTSAGWRIHPVDYRLQPEAWILVQPRTLVDASPNSAERLYYIKQSDVCAVFTVKE